MRWPAGFLAKAQSHSARVRGTKVGSLSPKTRLKVARIGSSSPGRKGRMSYCGAGMASAERVAAGVEPVLEEPAHDRGPLEAPEAQELARAAHAEAGALEELPLGRRVGEDRRQRGRARAPRARDEPVQQAPDDGLVVRSRAPVVQDPAARDRVADRLAPPPREE